METNSTITMDRPNTTNDAVHGRRAPSDSQYPVFESDTIDECLCAHPPEGNVRRVPSFLAVMGRTRGITTKHRHNSFRESTSRRENVDPMASAEELKRWARRPSIKFSIFGRSLFSHSTLDDTIMDEEEDCHKASSCCGSPHRWLHRVAAKLKQRPGLRDDAETVFGNGAYKDSAADTTLCGDEKPPSWSLSGGAAARAAAAAQNEALWPSYRRELSKVRDFKLSNDSESGIGIDVQDDATDVSVMGPGMVRQGKVLYSRLLFGRSVP